MLAADVTQKARRIDRVTPVELRTEPGQQGNGGVEQRGHGQRQRRRPHQPAPVAQRGRPGAFLSGGERGKKKAGAVSATVPRWTARARAQNNAAQSRNRGWGASSSMARSRKSKAAANRARFRVTPR